MESSDALPLAAPANPTKLSPKASESSGPSLGNEWTSASRKSTSAPTKAEFASHRAPALPPTSGNLSWRPRGAAQAGGLQESSSGGSPPTSTLTKAGGWDEVKPRTRSALTTPAVEHDAPATLADRFEEPPAASPRSVAPRPMPVKLSAPTLAERETSMDDEPPADPDYEPSSSRRSAQAPSKSRSRIAAPPAEYDPEGEVPTVFDGRDCSVSNAACRTAKQCFADNKLDKLKLQDFLGKGTNLSKEDFLKSLLDISPGAPLDNKTEIVRCSKEDALRQIMIDKDAKGRALATQTRHTWTNRQDKPMFEGVFAGFEYGNVLIKKSNGQMARVPLDDLSDNDVCLVTRSWGLPTECNPHEGTFADRNFCASTFTWKASALCHKPLYFEQVQLERYGHTPGPILEPFTSGAHFFVNIALLPYSMGIHPPGECQYALGYYRPGSCAPWMIPAFPLSLRGAAFQAGAVYGVHAMFP